MTISTTHPAIRRALPPSYEVMADVCNETGRKVVAKELGLSPAIVHKWCEPSDVSGAVNPLDRIARITAITGDTRLVEWLCAMAGGSFVPAPAPLVDVPRDLNVLTRKVGVEVFATYSELVTAGADGRVCPAETQRIRSRWQSTAGVAESAIVAFERGDFSGGT